VKVVVAGGRGFVGRHVCAWLARAGHEVAVAGRGDSLDGDIVIHLALFDEATARTAVAAVGSRPLVVASSGDVYRVYDQLRGREPWEGVQPGMLSEDAPLRAELYPYGREAVTPKGTFVDYDKILVERAVLAAGATVLRLPKVYGPGDPLPELGPAVRRARAGAPVVIGNRVAAWRWTHGYVEDIAHAIGLAATLPVVRGRIYNVGEPDPPTAVERLRAAVGAVEIVADDAVPAELATPIANAVDLVYDTSRIRRELGYREPTAAVDALARTLAAIA
jgi:nucleoside-diphosphate-sugar epimerase